jgi:hypothetical protein
MVLDPIGYWLATMPLFISFYLSFFSLSLSAELHPKKAQVNISFILKKLKYNSDTIKENV